MKRRACIRELTDRWLVSDQRHCQGAQVEVACRSMDEALCAAREMMDDQLKESVAKERSYTEEPT